MALGTNEIQTFNKEISCTLIYLVNSVVPAAIATFHRVASLHSELTPHSDPRSCLLVSLKVELAQRKGEPSTIMLHYIW